MSSIQLYYVLKWPKIPPPIVDGLLRSHLLLLETWLDECLWITRHNYPEEYFKYADIIDSVTLEEKQAILLSPQLFEVLLRVRNELNFETICDAVYFYEQNIRIQRKEATGWSALTDFEVKADNITETSDVVGDSIVVDFDSPLASRIEPASSVLSKTPLPGSTQDREETLSKLNQAIELIDETASTAGRLIRNVSRCIRIRFGEEHTTAAETDPRVIGEVRLLNMHLEKVSIPQLADVLIHESLHNFLAMYELQNGSFVSYSQSQLSRPVSPWTGNPIPYNAFTHAVYIYYGVFQFYKLVYPAVSDASEREQITEHLTRSSRGFRVSDLEECLRAVGQSPDWVFAQYREMTHDVRAFFGEEK